MTALVANTFNWFGLDGIANWFKNLDARLEQHRKIKHTMKQLHSLSDRELNDIGIARGDIWAVAHGDPSFKRNAQANSNLEGWV